MAVLSTFTLGVAGQTARPYPVNVDSTADWDPNDGHEDWKSFDDSTPLDADDLRYVDGELQVDMPTRTTARRVVFEYNRREAAGDIVLDVAATEGNLRVRIDRFASDGSLSHFEIRDIDSAGQVVIGVPSDATHFAITLSAQSDDADLRFALDTMTIRSEENASLDISGTSYTATSTPTPTPTGATPTDSGTSGGAAPLEDDSDLPIRIDVSTPGFGPLAAALGIGGGALLARRRSA
jgi:hypothetical protein